MKRQKTFTTKIMVLLLGIVMIVSTSTVAFAWWDRLTQESDEQQLNMGYGVRLVLENETSEGQGVLVPEGSFYANVAGYTTEYVFTYVLSLEEDLDDFDLLIDITNLSIDGLGYNPLPNVHGPLSVLIDSSEGAFVITDYDTEITGSDTYLRLNGVLQGDGTVTIILTFTLMDHVEDASFEGNLVEAYEALAGKEITFDALFEIPVYEDQSESSIILEYIFKNLDPDDFDRTGNWSVSDEGFRSAFGLLFIANPYEAYEITLVAQLGVDEPEDSTSGGFALLFETTLDDALNDTGYALQFDRGYGGILVRPRTAGGEASPIIVVNHENNPFIPESKRDPFWTEVKTVVLRVEPDSASPGYKLLNVWIDGVHIIEDFSFESEVGTEQSYTGMRSWHRATDYRTLRIVPLDENE